MWNVLIPTPMQILATIWLSFGIGAIFCIWQAKLLFHAQTSNKERTGLQTPALAIMWIVLGLLGHELVFLYTCLIWVSFGVIGLIFCRIYDLIKLRSNAGTNRPYERSE